MVLLIGMLFMHVSLVLVTSDKQQGRKSKSRRDDRIIDKPSTKTKNPEGVI